MPSFLFYTSMSLLLFVAVLLILLVLIQKGRGGGLSSAFGGSGGSTAFGAKTGDVLTWATSIVFGVFILLAVILDLVVNHQYASPVTKVVATTPAAADTTTAAPVAPVTVTGADRIQQELDRMKHPASPATVPTTNPTSVGTDPSKRLFDQLRESGAPTTQPIFPQAAQSIPVPGAGPTTVPSTPNVKTPILAEPTTGPVVPSAAPPTTKP